MRKKCRVRFVLDVDNHKHLCNRANLLPYYENNIFMKNHPSSIGNDWGIIGSNCWSVQNSFSTLANTISYESVSHIDD